MAVAHSCAAATHPQGMPRHVCSGAQQLAPGGVGEDGVGTWAAPAALPWVLEASQGSRSSKLGVRSLVGCWSVALLLGGMLFSRVPLCFFLP